MENHKKNAAASVDPASRQDAALFCFTEKVRAQIVALLRRRGGMIRKFGPV